jgi:hypothetical protein
MSDVLDRPATDAEKADASARLEDLRKAIQSFHKARLKTGEMLMGLRPMKYTQAEAAQIVRQLRDQSLEQRMVDELRTLNRLLLQREPTVEEMEAGLPPQDQLGWLPAIPAAWTALSLAAIGGGAWTLTSYFNSAAERERRLQRELNPQAAFWSDVANTVTRYGMPVAMVGGSIFGVWWLWKKGKDKGLFGGSSSYSGTRRALPPARAAHSRTAIPSSRLERRRNPEPDEYDEDEDSGEEEEE